jgi:hypothetical protein
MSLAASDRMIYNQVEAIRTRAHDVVHLCRRCGRLLDLTRSTTYSFRDGKKKSHNSTRVRVSLLWSRRNIRRKIERKKTRSQSVKVYIICYNIVMLYKDAQW